MTLPTCDPPATPRGSPGPPSHVLLQEIRAYLDAVSVFKQLGHKPRWRPECATEPAPEEGAEPARLEAEEVWEELS